MDGLIDPLATFPVRIPSQNDYKSIKISSETPKLTLQKSQKTSRRPKTDNRMLTDNQPIKNKIDNWMFEW